MLRGRRNPIYFRESAASSTRQAAQTRGGKRPWDCHALSGPKLSRYPAGRLLLWFDSLSTLQVARLSFSCTLHLAPVDFVSRPCPLLTPQQVRNSQENGALSLRLPPNVTNVAAPIWPWPSLGWRQKQYPRYPSTDTDCTDASESTATPLRVLTTRNEAAPWLSRAEAVGNRGSTELATPPPWGTLSESRPVRRAPAPLALNLLVVVNVPPGDTRPLISPEIRDRAHPSQDLCKIGALPLPTNTACEALASGGPNPPAGEGPQGPEKGGPRGHLEPARGTDVLQEGLPGRRVQVDAPVYPGHAPPMVLLLEERGVGPLHHDHGEDVGGRGRRPGGGVSRAAALVAEEVGDLELRGEARVLPRPDELGERQKVRAVKRTHLPVEVHEEAALDPSEVQHGPPPPAARPFRPPSPGKRRELEAVNARGIVPRYVGVQRVERHLHVGVPRWIGCLGHRPARRHGRASEGLRTLLAVLVIRLVTSRDAYAGYWYARRVGEETERPPARHVDDTVRFGVATRAIVSAAAAVEAGPPRVSAGSRHGADAAGVGREAVRPGKRRVLPRVPAGGPAAVEVEVEATRRPGCSSCLRRRCGTGGTGTRVPSPRDRDGANADDKIKDRHDWRRDHHQTGDVPDEGHDKAHKPENGAPRTSTRRSRSGCCLALASALPPGTNVVASVWPLALPWENRALTPPHPAPTRHGSDQPAKKRKAAALPLGPLSTRLAHRPANGGSQGGDPRTDLAGRRPAARERGTDPQV
ncbi:hypothetical protein THAOC_30078 [Thalassiosira oceanica]|uniref:Uncharacterized protein n=1 Tax=Thalassiosira oceanica TaxID=159749 RepID=K0RC92_THAOC|nr:hypothetical protein THAOC_30078 [Thalassiosira oceanica]|eukprot:EJK50820.1 hypothetical protein THAOC_30078 [Thalassiosira oceanica]